LIDNSIRDDATLTYPMKRTVSVLLFLVVTASAQSRSDNRREMCLDGLCIGQSISDGVFEKVDWIVPNKELTKQACQHVACQPDVAFRGYSSGAQRQLADALAWVYGSIWTYNVVTKDNVAVLRQYKYECADKERHFMAAYFSTPSHYLTVLGLRLIDGKLRIYRIVRQYPFHNQNELGSLARKLRDQYGDDIVFYDGISSNAYSSLIAQRKRGWFGRSSPFNPLDPSDNAAELVLIDPVTHPLLQPTAMPDSGEILHLSGNVPDQCNRSLPIQ
jgi:hypothetical protein